MRTLFSILACLFLAFSARSQSFSEAPQSVRYVHDTTFVTYSIDTAASTPGLSYTWVFSGDTLTGWSVTRAYATPSFESYEIFASASGYLDSTFSAYSIDFIFNCTSFATPSWNTYYGLTSPVIQPDENNPSSLSLAIVAEAPSAVALESRVHIDWGNGRSFDTTVPNMLGSLVSFLVGGYTNPDSSQSSHYPYFGQYAVSGYVTYGYGALTCPTDTLANINVFAMGRTTTPRFTGNFNLCAGDTLRVAANDTTSLFRNFYHLRSSSTISTTYFDDTYALMGGSGLGITPYQIRWIHPSSADFSYGDTVGTIENVSPADSGTYTLQIGNLISGSDSFYHFHVSVTGTHLADYGYTDPTCGLNNGTITLWTNSPNRTFYLNYFLSGTSVNDTVTSDSAGFILLGGLASGYYSDFSVRDTAMTCGSNLVTTTDRLNNISGPVLSGIRGAASVCVGGNDTLGISERGTWSVNDTTLATISSTGILHARTTGTVIVTFTSVSICGIVADTTRSITLGGGLSAGTLSLSGGLCVGYTQRLSSTTPGGTWTSSDTSIAAIVAGTDTLRGVRSGTVTISYSITNSCGHADTSFTVTVGSRSAGTISGVPATLCSGIVDTFFSSVSGGVWRSSSSSIASIDSLTGVVTARSAGTAVITYLVSACGLYRTTQTVTVTALPDAGSIYMAYPACVGATATVYSTYSGGTWLVSDATIATISSGGLLTALSAGTVRITYAISNSCGYDDTVISVTTLAPPVVAGITGTSDICLYRSVTLTDSTMGGVWSVSDTSIVRASTAGLVFGLGAGTATISYIVTNACAADTATLAVTVHALPTISVASTTTCGSSAQLTASGATSYTWAPTAGLSCTACAVTNASPATTVMYTVVGTDAYGCASGNAITVNGNRIYGHITFASTTPDTTDAQVWLIQYNPSDSSISALDSTTTCDDGGTPYFEFASKPAGNYLVKAKLIYGNTPGTSGYLPTYSYSTAYWDTAAPVAHTTNADSAHIHMLYGTVPSGSGFIGGSVVSGAGKGTAGEIAEVGLIVYLKDASGAILTYTYTDAAGQYSFSGLGDGTYYVYPADISYYTSPSAAIILSASSPSATGIKFKKYTTSEIILPFITTGVDAVAGTNRQVTLFPNPTTGNVVISWGAAVTGAAVVTLTDVAGREVYQTKWVLNNDNHQTVQLSGISNGVYLINIKGMNLNYTGKVVIAQ